MEKGSQNPLTRFERPARDVGFLVLSGAIGLVLIAGMAVSVRAGDWPAFVLFLLALAGSLLLILVRSASQRRREAVDDRKFIRWDAALPEMQRQDVNIEVRELAKVLGVEGSQLTDLLSAYIVAGDLALRQIQQEENLPLMRHVSIGGSSFDGIMVDHDLITCIEVSFLVEPDLRRERTDAILKKVALAKRNLQEMKSRLRLKLMVVLVTQLSEDEGETLRSVLKGKTFNDTPVDVDVRMLDFEMLQKVYLSE